MTLIKDIKSTDWGCSLKTLGEVVQGIDDINQCIQIILFTKKGTDALRPEFGCSIFDFIDLPLNVAGPSIILSVADALKKWEKRIKVTKITPSYTSAGLLNISIEWNYLNAVKTEQVDITYGLAA